MGARPCQQVPPVALARARGGTSATRTSGVSRRIPGPTRSRKPRDWIFNRERCSAFALGPESARRFYERADRPAGALRLRVSLLDHAVRRRSSRRRSSTRDASAAKAAVTTSEVVLPEWRERIEADPGLPRGRQLRLRRDRRRGDRVRSAPACTCRSSPSRWICSRARRAPGDAAHRSLQPRPADDQVPRRRLCSIPRPATRRARADAGCRCSAARSDARGQSDAARRTAGELPHHHVLCSSVTASPAPCASTSSCSSRKAGSSCASIPARPGAMTRSASSRAEARAAFGWPVEIKLVERFERRGRGKHRDFVRAEDLERV